jgi:hypothetical protein
VRAASPDLTPDVRLVMSAEPTTAQVTAWRRLWALLLADEPKNTKAPSVDSRPQSVDPAPSTPGQTPYHAPNRGAR